MQGKKMLQTIKQFLHDRHKMLPFILLVLILLIAGFLRFYRLGADGVGNVYYAAAVKSMLQSWHNFFFVAFEPGGSLSLDKPPLGFWVQAISARVLGFSGFALALPNAIAGVLSVLVLYKLISRPFGPWAGLLAALALAVTPVAISAERNNTIDGLLVFVLLLAAWAFLEAVYTGRLRWLFAGAMLVGLGFNIKMMQAFLPLPAFYAVYFFGTKFKWWKKLLHLAAATLLLLVVSFSWAVAVDLVPASARPYVDSTGNNTVLELIFGHNGIERLISLRSGIGLDGGGDGLFQPGSQPPFPAQPGQLPQQSDFPRPPLGQGLPPGAGQPVSPSGFAPGSMDFGTAGTLRLFTEPLAGEVSWLLPFALAGIIVLGVFLWKRPSGGRLVALILWASWLLPEAVYFTYSGGLMHSYYLIMMGAPVAALTAMTAWGLLQIIRERPLAGWGLAALLCGGTLAFEGFVLWSWSVVSVWAIAGAGVLFAAGLVLALARITHPRASRVALGCLAASVLVAPALWSVLTTFNPTPNSALPTAGPSGAVTTVGGPPGQDAAVQAGQDTSLIDYLLANTQPGAYLLATDRANDAAPYILATGRPVLTFGGFLGEYQEVSVDQLASLVHTGRLRFVLSRGAQQFQDLTQWVQANCQAVEGVLDPAGGASLPSGDPGGQQQAAVLYDCGAGTK